MTESALSGQEGVEGTGGRGVCSHQGLEGQEEGLRLHTGARRLGKIRLGAV